METGEAMSPDISLDFREYEDKGRTFAILALEHCCKWTVATVQSAMATNSKHFLY